MDSAVTTALCQGIMSPAASGLGGGNFMIIRSPNGTTEVIDAREVAPAAATENMFKGLFASLLSVAQSNGHKQACMQIHRGTGLLGGGGRGGGGGGGVCRFALYCCGAVSEAVIPDEPMQLCIICTLPVFGCFQRKKPWLRLLL